jgi:hypothetical protein
MAESAHSFTRGADDLATKFYRMKLAGEGLGWIGLAKLYRDLRDENTSNE